MWFWSVSLADHLSSQLLILFGRSKEKCPLSETRQFFLRTKEIEKLTGQLVGHEADQNPLDVPEIS